MGKSVIFEILDIYEIAQKALHFGYFKMIQNNAIGTATLPMLLTEQISVAIPNHLNLVTH